MVTLWEEIYSGGVTPPGVDSVDGLNHLHTARSFQYMTIGPGLHGPQYVIGDAVHGQDDYPGAWTDFLDLLHGLQAV